MFYGCFLNSFGEVAELVYARHSKCRVFGHRGSSPLFATIIYKEAFSLFFFAIFSSSAASAHPTAQQPPIKAKQSKAPKLILFWDNPDLGL